MSLPDFEALLKRAIGLDASTIGSSSVVRAVAIRMSANSNDSPEDYYRLVLQSSSELQQLIEAVVVPETWFFRDREAFIAMKSFACERRRLVQGPFHVLSIPCSTGEEPYSMAMALLDAGFTSEQFRIDAADVSARALAFARRAVYGRNSFRGSSLGFRDHHFSTTAAGYELKEDVRASVRFEHGNLFDQGLLAARAPYHAVFCRNLLIYFDADGKDKAVRALDRLLDPNGMMFVGPSESSLLLDNGYVSARIPLAFAFRKQNATEPMKARPAVLLPKSGMSASPPPLPVSPRTSAERATPLFNPPEPLQPRTPIEDIRRLADEGRLVEAAVRCEEHLRGEGASPEVLLILGLVRDALGEGKLAAECYRKALFLDPNHAQALIHLALLHEKAGNVADAKILHERLQRLKQRSAS